MAFKIVVPDAVLRRLWLREATEMKTLTMGLVMSLAMLGASGLAAQQQTVSGEVMDSSCARMGSHEAMEKQHNMPANAASDKACTLGCVKGGAKLVLYDSSTKSAYELDDQKKAEQFAGEKVTVTGTLDKANNTIHVAKISKAA
jgi:hypothetical protein